MVTLIGYAFAAFGLYLLYENELVVGAIFCFLGGFFAGKLKINTSSIGVMTALLGASYGWHNGFTNQIIAVIAVGVLLIGIAKSLGDWGYDIDFGEVGGRDRAKKKRL